MFNFFDPSFLLFVALPLALMAVAIDALWVKAAEDEKKEEQEKERRRIGLEKMAEKDEEDRKWREQRAMLQGKDEE